MAIDLHNCSEYPAQGSNITGSTSSTTKQEKCRYSTCNQKVLISKSSDIDTGSSSSSTANLFGYYCEGCDLCFCLKHRHPQDHQCLNPAQTVYQQAQQRQENAKLILQKAGIGSSQSKQQKPTSKTTYNPKIELMKIKMKAEGDKSIASDKRLYLRLISSDVNLSLFVSVDWSVGKVLDILATYARLNNRNNQIGETDPDRIILYEYQTGKLINPFSDPIGKVVENGMTVAVDYLRNYYQA